MVFGVADVILVVVTVAYEFARDTLIVGKFRLAIGVVNVTVDGISTFLEPAREAEWYVSVEELVQLKTGFLHFELWPWLQNAGRCPTPNHFQQRS